MANRTLRYAANGQLMALATNPQHDLAHNHSLAVYGADAVYSMIPKNACSSLRLSIAMANGAIDNEASWRWIHSNNLTFKPTLKDLATAKYTFTFLRCPYARLVSCFLDKMVSRTADAWQFHKLIDEALPLPRLTFRRFCTEMAAPKVKHANIHWRPQVDFLVYKTYDNLFCVEDFASAAAKLDEKIGLRLIDSRPLVKHDSSHFRILPFSKSFADTEVWQLEAMMMKGIRPNPMSFYDDGLRDLVATAYAEDFRLFRQLFSGKGLFDAPPEIAVAS